MAPDAAISFRRITDADMPLLRRWLEGAHVREWWGEPDTEIELIRTGEATGESVGYLASDAGEPVAYLQTWTPSAHDEEEWQLAAPKDVVGIDMFVGPPDRVGRGLGSRVLAAFATRLAADGATRIWIDPDAGNGRAVRAYEKAGFRAFARAGRDGDTVLMQFIPGETR